MDAELKAKWVAALRSGEYLQLQDAGSHWRRYGRHCCLAVLAEVMGAEEALEQERFGIVANKTVGKAARIELTYMNDGRDKYKTPRNFAQIADWIEANL